MFQIVSGLFELVFPSKCRICDKKSPEPVCPDCFASLPRIKDSICDKCGKPCLRSVDRCRECANKDIYFSLARSAGKYAGPLKKAIQQLKYENGKRVAPYLAQLVLDSKFDFVLDVDMVAFVPLTRYKEAKRGYNQSALIARELSRYCGKPLYCDLIKTKETPDQNKMGLNKRSSNVKGAYAAKTPVHGKVLLIDDVYTTGSTVNECARA